MVSVAETLGHEPAGTVLVYTPDGSDAGLKLFPKGVPLKVQFPCWAPVPMWSMRLKLGSPAHTVMVVDVPGFGNVSYVTVTVASSVHVVPT